MIARPQVSSCFADRVPARWARINSRVAHSLTNDALHRLGTRPATSHGLLPRKTRDLRQTGTGRPPALGAVTGDRAWMLWQAFEAFAEKRFTLPTMLGRHGAGASRAIWHFDTSNSALFCCAGVVIGWRSSGTRASCPRWR